MGPYRSKPAKTPCYLHRGSKIEDFPHYHCRQFHPLKAGGGDNVLSSPARFGLNLERDRNVCAEFSSVITLMLELGTVVPKLWSCHDNRFQMSAGNQGRYGRLECEASRIRQGAYVGRGSAADVRGILLLCILCSIARDI